MHQHVDTCMCQKHRMCAQCALQSTAGALRVHGFMSSGTPLPHSDVISADASAECHHAMLLLCSIK